MTVPPPSGAQSTQKGQSRCSHLKQARMMEDASGRNPQLDSPAPKCAAALLHSHSQPAMTATAAVTAAAQGIAQAPVQDLRTAAAAAGILQEPSSAPSSAPAAISRAACSNQSSNSHYKPGSQVLATAAAAAAVKAAGQAAAGVDSSQGAGAVVHGADAQCMLTASLLLAQVAQASADAVNPGLQGQPSIVERMLMKETSVDPRDAATLLPGNLLSQQSLERHITSTIDPSPPASAGQAIAAASSNSSPVGCSSSFRGNSQNRGSAPVPPAAVKAGYCTAAAPPVRSIVEVHRAALEGHPADSSSASGIATTVAASSAETPSLCDASAEHLQGAADTLTVSVAQADHEGVTADKAMDVTSSRSVPLLSSVTRSPVRHDSQGAGRHGQGNGSSGSGSSSTATGSGYTSSTQRRRYHNSRPQRAYQAQGISHPSNSFYSSSSQRQQHQHPRLHQQQPQGGTARAPPPPPAVALPAVAAPTLPASPQLAPQFPPNIPVPMMPPQLLFPMPPSPSALQFPAMQPPFGPMLEQFVGPAAGSAPYPAGVVSMYTPGSPVPLYYAPNQAAAPAASTAISAAAAAMQNVRSYGTRHSRTSAPPAAAPPAAALVTPKDRPQATAPPANRHHSVPHPPARGASYQPVAAPNPPEWQQTYGRRSPPPPAGSSSSSTAVNNQLSGRVALAFRHTPQALAATGQSIDTFVSSSSSSGLAHGVQEPAAMGSPFVPESTAAASGTGIPSAADASTTVDTEVQPDQSSASVSYGLPSSSAAPAAGLESTGSAGNSSISGAAAAASSDRQSRSGSPDRVMRWLHVLHARHQAPRLTGPTVKELVKEQIKAAAPVRAPWYRYTPNTGSSSVPAAAAAAGTGVIGQAAPSQGAPVTSRTGNSTAPFTADAAALRSQGEADLLQPASSQVIDTGDTNSSSDQRDAGLANVSFGKPAAAVAEPLARELAAGTGLHGQVAAAGAAAASGGSAAAVRWEMDGSSAASVKGSGVFIPFYMRESRS